MNPPEALKPAYYYKVDPFDGDKTVPKSKGVTVTVVTKKVEPFSSFVGQSHLTVRILSKIVRLIVQPAYW